MKLLRPRHTVLLSSSTDVEYFESSKRIPDWFANLRRRAKCMLPLLFSTLVACSGSASVVGPDAGEDPDIVSVQVEPSEVELVVGDTTRLSLQGRDAEGHAVPIENTEAAWESSDTTVATVDPSGLVRTLTDGQARIDAELPETEATLVDSTHVHSVPADSSDGSQGGSGGSSGDDSGGDSGDGPSPSTPQDDFRAFPEAQGYGAQALMSCDRSNIQVLRVTNLQDSGAGSLRDALHRVASGVLSVVVFHVAGYIDIGPRINVSGNCLYVAGQTAPGDGITLRAQGGAGVLLEGGVHDVVFRYLRMRGGFHGDSRGHNNLLIGSGHNVVLDHLSLGWTTNYLLGIMKYDDVSWSQPVSRISVQRTLFHEVFAAHPTAVQITGHGPDAWTQISQIALHHNLFAHNHHRNPMNNTHGLKLVNNVIYNWTQGATQNGYESRIDVIGNYYKMGPMGDGRFPWEVTWYCHHADQYQPSFYLSGNIGPNNDDPNADNWTGDSRMIACYYESGDFIGQQIPEWETYHRTTPLPRASVPIRIQSANQAYESVLDDVGANARLACRGGWISNADAVDRRVIQQTRRGTGISQPPETENDVGGFPTVWSGAPCSDADADGMPDEFEERFGLDASYRADASSDSDGDGYSNLEEYLNGTLPK